MTTYLFETMSASDAAAFDSTDTLVFLSTAASTINVVENAATPLQNASVTITSGAHALTFGEAQIAAASAVAGHISFNNGDHLYIGTSATDDTITASAGTAGTGTSIFGFDGDDSLTGGNGNDTILGGDGNDHVIGVSALNGTASDYLMGGDGADTITGGLGNDHIYGNAVTAVVGASDLGDSIAAGTGNDYVNGNAGADSILGEAGNDRLYGGADNDTIDGGLGNDYLQGNKGADSLTGFDGNDVIHGGADNDALLGGNGADQLFGDAGNDVLTGGLGYDQNTGGAGADVFTFGATDADILNLTSASTATNHGLTETVLDFTHGTDSLEFNFTGIAPTILYQSTGVTFTTADAALTYAQGLINADVAASASHVHDVAAINVGTDTYLFYAGAAAGGTTIDSVVKLAGVTASSTTFTASDIV